MALLRPSSLIPNLSSIGDAPTRLAFQIVDQHLLALRTAVIPIRGTLSPDTRPAQLTRNDAGLVFHATDFDRLFVWLGTAWADPPGVVPRGMIGYFRTSPGAGWALCNGARVLSTTSSGTLTSVEIPVLPPTEEGLSPYLRL